MKNKEHFEKLIKVGKIDKDIIPLFFKDESGELYIISNIDKDKEDFKKGWKLVYLGNLWMLKQYKRSLNFY